MGIQLELPDDLERAMRAALAQPLEVIAKEALLAEAYRRGVISLGRVAEILSLPTRYAAEQWLRSRGVTLNYGSAELQEDRETLSKTYGKAG